jgi:hypothetical protein
MVRAYTIYVGMFVALVVGLWAILTAGSRLTAPEDLSGEWHVTWATTSPTGGSEPDGTMRVQQSGRFFNVTFDDALQLRLKLADGDAAATPAGGTAPSSPKRLVGDPWVLSVQRIPASGDLALELAGPETFQGIARRPADSQPVDSVSAQAGGAAPDAPSATPNDPAPTAATHARP